MWWLLTSTATLVRDAIVPVGTAAHQSLTDNAWLAGRENEAYIKEQLGAPVLFVEADVSKDEDVKAMVEATIKTFGE
jgi:NAD(P)-dependent dehydrogenase (short-subunit alcohol dehydrogenase family)